MRKLPKRKCEGKKCQQAEVEEKKYQAEHVKKSYQNAEEQRERDGERGRAEASELYNDGRPQMSMLKIIQPRFASLCFASE